MAIGFVITFTRKITCVIEVRIKKFIKKTSKNLNKNKKFICNILKHFFVFALCI